jgi:superfamily II DNA/RNA helicase
VRIQVDAADKSSETIKHQVLFCRRRTKLPKLKALLLKESYVGVIFTRTRLGADQIFREVRPSIKEIGILHAGYGMNDREKTIRAFRDEKINLLVATDVASRGLDINHLNAVIQYDPPESLEDYIHRSGRSGRAGRTGLSILFIEEDNPDQLRFFEELKKKVKFDVLDADPSSSSSKEPKNMKSPPSLTQAAKKLPKSPSKAKEAGPTSSWKARAIAKTKYWLRVLFKG